MDEQDLQAAFQLLEDKKGLKLFEVANQSVFPVYGISGGLITSKVFYLIKVVDDMYLVMPVWYKTPIEECLVKAVYSFHLNAKVVNPNGGDMGLPTR